MTRYFVAEDGSLKIQKLAMEDGGMFQCVASNSAGQATAYTWLKVKSKSLFKGKLKRQETVSMEPPSIVATKLFYVSGSFPVFSNPLTFIFFVVGIID